MKVSDKIRDVREAKHLSQEYMAEVLKLSVNGYGRIERGEVKLTVERLLEIAQVLDVEPEQLIKTGNQTTVTNVMNGDLYNSGTINNCTVPTDLQGVYENEIQHLKDKIRYLEEMIEMFKQQDKHK